jgi:hypothetical protein
MKHKVWKYRLKRNSRLQEIPLPKGAKILSIDAQHDTSTHQEELTMWVIFDVKNEHRLQYRKIQVVMTGKTYDNLEGARYLGHVVMDVGGSQVYHCFEVK